MALTADVTVAEVRSRNRGFECLRAAACVSIVLLHTLFSTTLMYAGTLTARQRLVCELLMNNLMWAVPCFLMVTGALLLPPEKVLTYKTLFGRYIARCVKAIVCFGLAYVLAEMIFYSERRTAEYFLRGLYRIFTGDIWSHMWYLYCLLGLYLLLPFYKKIAALSDKRDMRYLLSVYAVFLSILPRLEELGVRCGFYIHVSSVYPFWLFLGYYLHRWGRGRSRRFYAALCAAGTILLCGLTLARTFTALSLSDGLFEYSSPFVIVQAAGVAGCFFQTEPGRASGRLASCVDARSFGIYLIHMLFVRLIYKHLHFDPFALGPLWLLGVLGVVLASFLASYFWDTIFKKLPFFRDVL